MIIKSQLFAAVFCVPLLVHAADTRIAQRLLNRTQTYDLESLLPAPYRGVVSIHTFDVTGNQFTFLVSPRHRQLEQLLLLTTPPFASANHIQVRPRVEPAWLELDASGGLHLLERGKGPRTHTESVVRYDHSVRAQLVVADGISDARMPLAGGVVFIDSQGTVRRVHKYVQGRSMSTAPIQIPGSSGSMRLLKLSENEILVVHRTQGTATVVNVTTGGVARIGLSPALIAKANAESISPEMESAISRTLGNESVPVIIRDAALDEFGRLYLLLSRFRLATGAVVLRLHHDSMEVLRCPLPSLDRYRSTGNPDGLVVPGLIRVQNNTIYLLAKDGILTLYQLN